MRRSLLVVTLAALTVAPIALPLGAAAQTGGPVCHQVPLTHAPESTIEGQARLCTDDSGVMADIDATNLARGDAYTVWFVYFDRPTDCQSVPCQPVDTTGDNPPAVLARVDGIVADESAAHFSGQFRGLRLSSGAEIHVPIFDHGAAALEDNKARARQLLTPQVPALGAPGLGVAADGRLGFMHAVAMFDIP
jgi:hypothetical protein